MGDEASSTLTLKFTNFWSGFDRQNNFFIELIQSRGKAVTVVENYNLPIDIEIVSVFYDKRMEYLTKAFRKAIRKENFPTQMNNLHNRFHPIRNPNVSRRIWYTGENFRIPFGQNFDGYLSFDATQEHISNAYLPLWMLGIGWFKDSSLNKRVGSNLHVDELLKPRKLESEKHTSVIAFVGNPESVRLWAISSMESHIEFVKYGRFYGRFTPEKYSLASKHKFILTFENDLYPGYVSEKLVENYAAGSVPIYRGLFNPSESHFNPKAYVDCSNFSDFKKCAIFLEGMSSAEYQRIYEEPLLLSKPNLDPIAKVLLG